VSRVAAAREKKRDDGGAMVREDGYLERFKVCMNGRRGGDVRRKESVYQFFYVKACIAKQ
jgi:hypothetical protein